MASSRRHAAQFSSRVAVVNTDSATLAFKLTPSVSESGPILDAGAVRLSLTPSTAEAIVYVEATLTVPFKLTPVTTYESPGASSDFEILLFSLTPSGVEFKGSIFPYLDVATEYLHLTPTTAFEGTLRVDAGTALLRFTIFADEHYCPQKVEFEGDMNVRWVAGIQGRLLAQFDGSRWDANFLGVGDGYNC